MLSYTSTKYTIIRGTCISQQNRLRDLVSIDPCIDQFPVCLTSREQKNGNHQLHTCHLSSISAFRVNTLLYMEQE